MKKWNQTLPVILILSLILSCLPTGMDRENSYPLMVYYKNLIDSLSVQTPTIQNLQEGSIVETGFVIGSASDDSSVASVEVSLDGGSYASATGTTSWSYQLPTGSSTWRDSSKHTVSVRSVDDAGTYSSISTITVHKGTNKDINGDGYADLVVGADGYISFTGRIYIYYSSGSAGISASNAASADNTITGEAAGIAFGADVTTGDINGDGYADVVAGAADYGSSAGRVYLFYSSGSTGISDSITTASSASTIIDGEATNSQFGSSLATGDITGDGYADLVVGAMRYDSANTDTGRVYLFHSTGTSGITTTSALSADGKITGEAASNLLGGSVATGDLNGDGYADLVTGASNYSSNAGRAYYFESGGSSGISITLAGSATGIRTGSATPSQFGNQVATGDINGDGYDDLVVSATSYYNNESTGRVYIFYSSNSGMTGTLDAETDADRTLTGITTNTKFGSSIAAADVDGDGYVDLIASAPAAATLRGTVYIFRSTGTSGISDSASTASDATWTINENSEAYGSALGCSIGSGDFNGDGYTDIVAGGYRYPEIAAYTGRVYLFHSAGSTGIGATSVGDATTTVSSTTNTEYFGWSVW